VTNVVRKDDEVAAGIEKLPGTKENSGKNWAKKLAPGSAGAVQDQNCICDFAARIFLWLPERVVVHAQFGQALAGLEVKIVNREIAFIRRRDARLLCLDRNRKQ
jgi:hypothetical protein